MEKVGAKDVRVRGAGANLTQRDDGTIFLGQKSYTEKWVEEIPIDSRRAAMKTSKATPREISDIRGALGTVTCVADRFVAQRNTDSYRRHDP